METASQTEAVFLLFLGRVGFAGDCGIMYEALAREENNLTCLTEVPSIL